MTDAERHGPRPGITENMLGRWKNEYLEDQGHAFIGKSHMKPAEAELFQLKKRIADLEQRGKS